MKYKAIFIDVDGTLLTDDLTILPATKKVLKDLSDSGILISIVTGRSPMASLFLYEELGFTQNPIICLNGSLIIQNDEILHEVTLDSFQLRRIIDELKCFPVTTSLYWRYGWFTNRLDFRIEKESEITNTKITEINYDQFITNDFKANKILCIAKPSEIEALESHLKSNGFADLNIHKSNPSFLEIMSKKASKSLGIEKLINLYQIKKEDIIAIGDNFNDVDMLLYAGTSIAMSNAPYEVKKLATFVTDTNNNDGIQKALNQLIV